MMRRVTRDRRGEPVIGQAPEKIADAIEDLVAAVERALVEDGVDGIGLERRMSHLEDAVTYIVRGFNDARIADFEQRVDEQLCVNALVDAAEVDVTKLGSGWGSAAVLKSIIDTVAGRDGGAP